MIQLLFLISSLSVVAGSLGRHNPYSIHRHEQGRHNLEVNLGYERYEGQTEGNISTWLGVRYGTSTGGTARFQAPQVPKTSSNQTATPAASFPDSCTQFYLGSYAGSEDCLFLNVYAPNNAKNLPVFVFIHGGAYQAGYAGGSDPTDFIINNDGRFLAVMIQYRLGVFGFLGTEEVKRNGQLNAGLLDMELALQWVQNYIPLFGGNPRKVTIAGESAGGGAVMLMSLLRGGRLGDSLFHQVISSSPYLPKQFDYDSTAPRLLYQNVSSVVGCNNSRESFDCLVKADVKDLCTAGFNIDNDPMYSQYIWGFVPVTDGIILEDLPSRQLQRRRVNGKRILTGYNSNEGSLCTPLGINTNDDFNSYLSRYLPNVSSRDQAVLKSLYPTTHDTDSSLLNYDTDGTGRLTANSMSDWGNGQQQRAFNMLAETLLMCPTYWLSEAFAQAWKYEFALTPAYHSFDTGVLFYQNQSHPSFTNDFVMAFQHMWGNFIVHGNPAIAPKSACGETCASNPTEYLDATLWPRYTKHYPAQLTVNVTGGHVGTCQLYLYSLRCAVGPGLRNRFTLANAREWQGGRGERCSFWQRIGPSVPQ